MIPVLQEDRTGCGIAAVATIAGVSYQEAKRVAASLGIVAHDPALWSETAPVRALLARFGATAPVGVVPFSSWEALPDLALLSIKWRWRGDRPVWHWVVFVRIGGQAMVLDSKKGLRRNIRTDFGRMAPKWSLPVRVVPPGSGALPSS